MLTMALNAYAWIICRLIWGVTKILMPWRTSELVPLEKNHLMRDYEWAEKRDCLRCGNRLFHKMIEWLPDRVVTAECPCGHEETLA